jgi:hypothetical protein
LIWLYAAGAALPWSIVMLGLLLKKPVSAAARRPSRDPQMAYLWCWVLAPLLLFTPARNILEAYALPALPAFALITARLFMERERRGTASRVWLLGLIMPLVACGLLVGGQAGIEGRSQRLMLARLKGNEGPLVYLYKRPFSGQFYSAGKAIEVRDAAEVERWLATETPATLLVPEPEFTQLGLATDPRWLEVARHGGYVMLQRRSKP